MWRTGITIGLGWLALFAGFGVGIWQFAIGEWIGGVIALGAAVAAITLTTATANALTRTMNR